MADSNPSDTMRGRVDESRYKIWVLTRMNRWGLAAAVSFGMFLILVLISFIEPVPMRAVIDERDANWWVFSAMITAIITAVSLVVSFNQLVLSQELGALGDQQERMGEATAFRDEVEPWLTNDVAPPDPASFLSAILDGVQTVANDLAEDVPDDGTEASSVVTTFVDELTENAQAVGERLEDAQFGTFDVIFAALNFNYSWKIYEGRRILAEHGGDLNESTVEQIEDIVTVLELFGPAREHFKTLYFQWELVNLSRAMLYSAVPALLVAVAMLLYVDTAGITGTLLGIDLLVWVVSAAVTITLIPFVVLLSFVLRIATVTKRTLAIGPFVLRETERSGDLSWDSEQ